MSTEHIAVGICTLRRPDGLERLLEALTGQRFAADPPPRLTVVVVDNDEIPSAAPVIDSFRARFADLRYHHEPRRGLVYARNAVLDATPAEADWLASIDDDEVPPAGWLDGLWQTARRFEVPLVAGAVEPVFDTPPPEWAQKGDFFRKGPFADGMPTRKISTHNALVSLAMIRRHQWRFDPAFNLSGGEDEHFFQRALDQGYRAVTAADATVVEHIPPERLGLQWLWRRYRRLGTTNAQLDRRRDRPWRHIPLRVLKGGGRFGRGLGLLLSSLWRGRLNAIAGWCEIARATGMWTGLLGARLEEYENAVPPTRAQHSPSN